MRTTANTSPRDNVVASDRLDRTTQSQDRMTPADRTVSTELPVPTNRTGAGDNPYDSDRIVACADQKGDQTASMDCGPRNRRMDGGRTGSDKTAYDSQAGTMTACTSRTDGKGTVIYDDLTCPTRYGQPQQQTAENVYLTKQSAFFDRYIETAVKHAREAEIAGNQGHAPELLEHANLALAQAKQAQLAGNVPGLNEGIIALRAALTLPIRRTGSGDNRLASDRMGPCADQRSDATASTDCEAQNRRTGNYRTVSDRSLRMIPRREPWRPARLGRMPREL